MRKTSERAEQRHRGKQAAGVSCDWVRANRNVLIQGVIIGDTERSALSVARGCISKRDASAQNKADMTLLPGNAT